MEPDASIWDQIVFVVKAVVYGVGTIIGGSFLLLWDKIRGK
jgi:hypothetical protein